MTELTKLNLAFRGLSDEEEDEVEVGGTDGEELGDEDDDLDDDDDGLKDDDSGADDGGIEE